MTVNIQKFILATLLFTAAMASGVDAARATAASNTMKLTSGAFTEGSNIPDSYTCKGNDMSPDLIWSGAPANTASYALLVQDPDAHGGPFTHWIAYNIPADKTSLIANLPAAPETDHVMQGKNDFGKIGYGGPCPPKGDQPHRYIFTLYALDQAPVLSSGADVTSFRQAITGHVHGSAQLTGIYQVK